MTPAEKPPRAAMKAWREDRLPGWALMRALVSHRDWQVPASADGATDGAPPSPRVHRGDDGPVLRAWVDAESFAAAAPTDPEGAPATPATFTGAGLFGAVVDGLAAVVLEPDTDVEVRLGPEHFEDLRRWAAADRVARVVRGHDDRPDAFGALRRYDGWLVLTLGTQMMLAPDAQGRKLAAVFTAEDTLRTFLSRHQAAVQGRGLEVARLDGEALFHRLAATAGLDGVVFDCAGPLPPKAVSIAFAGEVLKGDEAPVGGGATAIAVAIRRAGQVAQQAIPTLRRFVEPGADVDALVAALLPRPGDAARVFAPAIADAVEAAYRDLIDAEPPRITPRPDQVRVECHACPAGLLDHDNVLSAPFPGGYRALAPYLVPERVWLCWRYTEPEADRGMAYNGLVWLDDRWVWFPKPYRVVGKLVS